MEFDNFLNNLTKVLESEKSVCFVGKTYPILFFNKVLKILKKNPLTVSFTPVDESAPNDVIGMLSQSFLGERNCYFLGEIKDSKDKKKKKIIDAVFEYSNVHKLVFYISKDSKLAPSDKLFHLVELEETVDRKLFVKLLRFLEKEHLLKKTVLIDKIFKKNSVISLENACRLFDYLEVVSLTSIEEFDHYLSLLLDPEQSFFTLSNYFFARDKQNFFKMWGEIHEDYSPLFWIVYWGDQIWKAHYVCKYLSANNIYEAKRMSVRLPFSFTKSYWKKFTTDELVRAYDFLYKSDHALKMSSNIPLLDLFYSKHFAKDF